MSLRSRLLAGVLVMTAVGLLAAGGGTYLALRSFLLGRVDQQLMASRAAVGRGLRQSTSSPIDATTLDRVAPPVAFVEVRDAAVESVATHDAEFAERSSPGPRLPAALHLPPRRAVSAFHRASRRCNSMSPRSAARAAIGCWSARCQAAAGVLVVAVALDDVDATLRHLLARRVADRRRSCWPLLAVAATFWLLSEGLRPLERISEIAGGIAQGDLDVRLSPGG